ncbi:MAG: hypothetical protein II998_07665 [Clostridia bacterium]|nr:hypothetical protein [Clostridia bacterium]
MKVNYEDFRTIIILVDQQKNIVIFPMSKTDYPIELADGTMIEYSYLPAYYPIELSYPYTATELADKIEYGINQWNVHKCYDNFSGKNTFEEKYYNIKGFKNAVKGHLYFRLGWDDIQKKYVTLMFPWKRGYSYDYADKKTLPDDADWIDYANAVIDYINMDFMTLEHFRRCKSEYNI